MPDFWNCEACSEPKHALLLRYLSGGRPEIKGLLTLVQKLAIRFLIPATPVKHHSPPTRFHWF